MIEFIYPHTHLVAGVDEVGRGPLVGAVVTAAVILDPNRPIIGLADSKNCQKSVGSRCLARSRKKHCAGVWAGLNRMKSTNSTSFMPPCLLCSARWRAYLSYRNMY